MTVVVPAGGTARVGVLMGSASDWPVMKAAVVELNALGVACEVGVSSAHRNPDGTAEFAKTAAARGLSVLICGAGGAAHLAGVVAAVTPLPVIAVPVRLKAMSGLDSLLSMVQMPAGIPVATVGIDAAANAGLLAARILGVADPGVAERVARHQAGLTAKNIKADADLAAAITQDGLV